MIHVKVKPHAHFKRENSDIHTDVRINLSQVSKIVVLVFNHNFKINRVQKYERDLKRWEFMEDQQNRDAGYIEVRKNKY